MSGDTLPPGDHEFPPVFLLLANKISKKQRYLFAYDKLVWDCKHQQTYSICSSPVIASLFAGTKTELTTKCCLELVSTASEYLRIF